MFLRSIRWAVLAGLFGIVAVADARALMIAPPRPGVQAIQSEVVIVGKVLEIEKETVGATVHPGAPKEQKAQYKIATVKITDPLIGARGITQLRIGFFESAPVPPPAVDGPAIALPRRGGPQAVALVKDQEGMFFLTPHHDGDFYVMPQFSGPFLKDQPNYAKELEAVKKVAKVLDEPVAALKSKAIEDRAHAAQVVLQRYRNMRVQTAKAPKEEEISEEENKLILGILTELPWTPAGNDYTKPSRSQLWYMIQPEKYGFKQPMFRPQPGAGGDPNAFQKLMEEATTSFLKENAAKIRIKRFVAAR